MFEDFFSSEEGHILIYCIIASIAARLIYYLEKDECKKCQCKECEGHKVN
jgi:hypothetical protein